MKLHSHLSRREFLKFTAMALAGLSINPGKGKLFGLNRPGLPQDTPPDVMFPENETLGRICVGAPGTRVDIKSEPYWDAPAVGTAWFDDVFPWQREVIASRVDQNRINQRWVETPEGFIYAEYVQKTQHIPQEPLQTLPETSSGDRGMWVEIVTPYTVLTFNRAPSQYWVRETVRPRIYYSQIFWAFDVRQDPTTGKIQYCLRQRYGALPDEYWVDASVCRRITPEEITPIHPEADDKSIIINVNYQTLACYEGDDEVFFARVTTGGYNYEEDKWQTPLGKHTIWRKLVSTHMSAGPAVGNYDISGVGWTTLFDPNGAAIHSTYWHNYYGTPRSHGCINMRPEDAKWVWRWTTPGVMYDPGDLIIQGLNQSTTVDVIEG
jgi:lipoprotein-anchoring transpeptidase ErfK/SrfK